MSLFLTMAQVRRLMIRAQGLDRLRPAHAAGDLMQSIERMGMLQIDTLSVVNRSHYFVLWSRHGAYPTEWLDTLLTNGDVFECWTHEACMAPRNWFPHHRRLIADDVRSTKIRWARAYLDQHRQAADAMLDHLQQRGSARADSFVRPTGIRGEWWDWSHEKQLLEALFACGDVMIARREGFRRVYARTDAVRPDWDEERMPGSEETATYQIRSTARKLGVVHPRWLGDYYRMQTALHRHIDALCARNELVPVTIEGLAGDAYMDATVAQALPARIRKTTHTTLLSPFDPLVWDRKRALDVFGFDYRIECYTPAHKRKYGYFTLPILHEDAIIGRVDCKVERRAGVFGIRALHFEDGYVLDDGTATRLAQMFKACADWHGASVIDAPGVGTDENGTCMRGALAALLP
jgi:uncharacterized protein